MNDHTRGTRSAARHHRFGTHSSHDGRETETVESATALERGAVDLDSLSQDELLEQICDDQVRRWRAGQRVPAEAYLARHPRLNVESEAAFELIYGEFLLREQQGDSAAPEEFYWRFPRFAARLARQLELHGVLNSDSLVVDSHRDPAQEGKAPDSGAGHAVRSIAPGYQILGELGRGGMGLVYKAWQVSLKRVVALKVIRAHAYADSGAAARFHAEAEAAARIQHPNIVQVFEVGENDGSGYLVLEYVAGEGLDRKLSGALQDPRDSARLIEILARAIHFAHQRGIVHRDLKPANVLLTEDGVPKITDFGLAKLLERDEGLTQIGDLLGTPSYMAPEQVRGRSDQITPATDVYALGAILYEMLTGRPPFKGTTPMSTLEQVSSQEPLNPSRIQRHLPRDLETICLKCLHKDPRRRYVAARDLADDLRRFLDSKPVLARPTPVWERAWKWARRRPAAAAVLCCAIAAALLVVGLGVHYNARLRAALRTAQAAEQAADSSALLAVEQRNLALKAFKQLVYDVQEKLGQTPATRSLRQALLNTAIAGLEGIAQSTAGSAPDLSQAVAHQKLGDIFRIIGRYADARLHYDRARGLSDALLASDSDDLPHGENLYQSHMGLGSLDITVKQYNDAKLEFRRAVAIAETIAANPKSKGGPEGLVEAYFQLGRSHSFAGEFAEAEVCFRMMQDLASRWASERPTETLAKDLLAASYRKLGDLKKFAKDYLGARKDYLTAIYLGRQALAGEPTSFAYKAHLAIGLDDLAGVARDQGDKAEAKELYHAAGQLGAELVKADPDALETRFRFLHTQYKLAKLEQDESRFARAAELLRGVLTHVNDLDRDGRLEGRHDSFTNPISLKSEIAHCDAAARAPVDEGAQSLEDGHKIPPNAKAPPVKTSG
jgi:eukaryotic-like serine/threonine-protein kinase